VRRAGKATGWQQHKKLDNGTPRRGGTPATATALVGVAHWAPPPNGCLKTPSHFGLAPASTPAAAGN